MKPKVAILGAGGHAKVLADAIVAEGRFELIGFLSLNPPPLTKLLEWPILGSDEYLMTPEGKAIDGFVIGFAGAGSATRREERFAFATALGFQAFSVLHPSATVSKYATCAMGATILAHSVVNSGAVIGSNVILNTGSIVEHDCTVAEHAHVGPGAVLTGGVRIGIRCTVGANAVVLPGLNIADDAVIGAGAVVTHNVLPGETVLGNPARGRA